MIQRGRSAIAICSDAFVGLGHMQSRAMRVPQLPIVVIPHPLGIRSREEVRAMAQACADEVARVMIEGGQP